MGIYNQNHKHLNIDDFQHPADRKSVAAVMAVPKLDKLLEFISRNSIERVYGFVNNSSRMKITEDMSPKIFGMLREAAEMYQTDIIPEVYLDRSYDYTINLDGMTRPYVVLTTAILENTPDDILWGMLSAQIAGIMAKHETMEFLDNVVQMTKGMLPFGIDSALELAISDWHRNRAYTADRAVLLAVGDFNTAAKVVLLGEAPFDVLDRIGLDQPENDYYLQAAEFLQRGGAEGAFKNMETMFSRNQWTASRYIELYNWYFSGEYDEVLERSIEE